METVSDFIFRGSKITAHGDCRQEINYFANKGLSSQGYGFSSSHVWMWELDCEESWAPKNWCFWTVVLEKTLESPLDCMEIQPVHSKGDQPWDIFGGMRLKLKLQYFGHLMWRVDWLEKTLMLGGIGDRRRRRQQEEKGTTEDEMAGWHHQLDGHESGWTPGVGDEQGGLEWFMWSQSVRYDWVTELNWTEHLCKCLEEISWHNFVKSLGNWNMK